MYFCRNLLSESPFDLTARDSAACEQPGTWWRCDTQQSIISSEGERWSLVVHRTVYVTVLWRNIWRWELVIQQDTIRSIARNIILGRWTLWRDEYFLLPNMSGMLLLHEPASSGICFVHISIYMKMRWLPIMHSTTALLTALNKIKTEGSGNIPVPITFLFIERLNKYLWKYTSCYVLLLVTNTFILNSH